MLFLNIMSIPQNYALNFAKEVDESLALSTGKMIPIYNSNDRLVGYSIEYYIDNTPYGYINLNSLMKNQWLICFHNRILCSQHTNMPVWLLH